MLGWKVRHAAPHMKTPVAVMLALTLSTQALAVECAAPEGTSTRGIAAQDTSARLAFLARLLEEEGQAARRWSLVWGGVYGVGTIAQLSLTGLVSKEDQPDMYWGALSTAVGVAFTVLDPLEVMEAGPLFAKRAGTVTDADACQLLIEGERLLREGAEHEAFGTRWFIHAGNVVFNVAIGLILGFGYGHWVSGLVNMGVGTAIGEGTIFSSPTNLVSGWKRYRDGEAAPKVTFHVVPTAGPGLGFVMRF